MAKKITDIAKDLGITTKEFRQHVETLGLGVGPRASTVKDEMAHVVQDRIASVLKDPKNKTESTSASPKKKTPKKPDAPKKKAAAKSETKPAKKPADKAPKKKKEETSNKPATKSTDDEVKKKFTIKKSRVKVENIADKEALEQKKKEDKKKADKKKRDMFNKKEEEKMAKLRYGAEWKEKLAEEKKNKKPIRVQKASQVKEESKSSKKPEQKKQWSNSANKPAYSSSAGKNKKKKKDGPDSSKMYFIENRRKKAKKEAEFKSAHGKTKTQMKKEARAIVEEEEKQKPKEIALPAQMTVSEFADILVISIGELMGTLMGNGVMLTANDFIDFETASIIASDLDYIVAEAPVVEETHEYTIDDVVGDAKDNLQERPPVIAVMGHVDHGKTSLLDTIRQTAVTSGEAGGITQHIGAYQVEKNNKKITFLDTPGHEAFTSMRAQGAKVADIVILVVAADDGVKPQTIEAINHAKAAGVPILVAINKSDLEAANPDKVKAELSEHELVSEDWGGTTTMIPLSAKTGQGIDELLDMILLAAEVEEFHADPSGNAIATVIEAHKDVNLGPVATVVVNSGTLNIGDNCVVASVFGKTRILLNEKNQKLKKAEPSTPVLIAGLDEVPKSGDVLRVMDTEKEARDLVLKIYNERKLKAFAEKQMTARDFAKKVAEGDMTTLQLIIKADTKGSIEAIKQSLGKIHSERVAIQIIHTGVGGVTESDIMMARASQAMLISLHVQTSATIMGLADREGVEIKEYNIIYKMIEDLEKVMHGLIEPEKEEFIAGKLEILGVFHHGKKEMIVGGKITEGYIQKDLDVKIFKG
ncbi:MAG: translation initiation factor IF-2 [Patescibacteria group bacterium]|nr:translation initiation factor IF-2 [Patescibacteria group bacterium]